MTAQACEATLDELARIYRTDKSSEGHNFAVQYDQVLQPIRHQVRRVLELGVDEGNSLRMWREYFTQAEIVGMDKDEKITELVLPDRVHRIRGGATLVTSAAPALGLAPDGYDLIIDDASHISSEQLEAMRVFWPCLRENGWYFVEDIEPGRFGPHFVQWLQNSAAQMYLPGAPAWSVREMRLMTGVAMLRKGAPETR